MVLVRTPSPPVMLVHWGSSGGGPRFLAETAAAMSKRASTIVSTARHVDNLAQIMAASDRVVGVRTYRSRWQVVTGVLRWPYLVWQVRAVLRDEEPVAVVSVMDHVYQSIVLPLALRRRDTFVVVIHDAALHPGEDVWIRRVGRWLERRRADQVVTLSQAVAGQLSDVRVPVHVAGTPPWTADRPITNTIRDDRAPDVLRIGMVGRLTAYKGVEIFVEAVRRLRAHGWSFEATVHGEGPSGREAASSAPDIDWDLRWIPADEFPALIGALDVLVLPYQEASQSGLIADAISQATPCVVSPVGGLASQVLEAGIGLVAASPDANDIAVTIERFLRDPSLAQSLREQSSQRRGQLYSWDDLAQLLLTVSQRQ